MRSLRDWSGRPETPNDALWSPGSFVLLREIADGLEDRAQAHAVDAGAAGRHKLAAKRK
jgi:hypothetical protein